MKTTIKVSLKPTLWRTARALANADRLRLLRQVYKSQGVASVTELAESVGLTVPVASTYLRALNARGLVSVVRTGSYVLYGTASDRSLPAASAIQSAFFGLFAQRDLPRGWETSLLPFLRGYAHPRREEIIRCLTRRAPLSFTELQRASGIPSISLLRHLAVLVPAGIVIKDEKLGYSLAEPDTDIAVAFLDAVRDAEIQPARHREQVHPKKNELSVLDLRCAGNEQAVKT